MYEEDKRTYNHMDDDLSEKQKENPDQIRSDSHDAQNQQEQRKQEQWTQGPRMQDYRTPDYHTPEHRGKKNGGVAKKAAAVTAAAVLFGVVAGGVMTGVNLVGSRLVGLYGNTVTAETAAQESSESVPQTTTAQTSESATAVSSSTNIENIVEQAMPSVVAINDTMTVEQRNFFGMPQTYQATSSGSGIIVAQSDTELLIATNNHVVSGATDLEVTFTDDTAVSAAIKGTDSASDLAIIAVQLSDIPTDTMNKIKVATMGDSDQLKVGQQVIAIGNALGYGQSVTVGYVSALNRQITDENGIQHTYIQTDAAINPGNSGGALLDLNGNVIGINAAKNASTEVEGMGFAIPSSTAKDILDNLMTKQTRIAVGEDAQGYLGIRVTNIDAATSQAYGMPVGVYVYQIMPEGAAANSDLKEKDIITKFDGQSITTAQELTDMLTYYEKGSEVTLTVQTLTNVAYVEHDVTVTLGDKLEE